LKFIREKMMIY